MIAKNRWKFRLKKKPTLIIYELMITAICKFPGEVLPKGILPIKIT